VTDTEVVYQDEDGTVRVMRWADITSVAIVTNDRGPFEEDVFWLLGTRDNSLLIPQMAAGTGDLLARVQQFPGFDNDAVIAAMGSVENQVFPCWRAGD
jgi:hypothetical protein